eukprot:6842_1
MNVAVTFCVADFLVCQEFEINLCLKPPTSMSDTTTEIRNISGIIGLILHWFIYLPLMVYYFKQFYDARNQIVIQKRHLKICYITFFVLFISIMIDRTSWWLFISKLYEPAIWIMLITYPTVTLGIHYCMLFRFWMVKFDFEYSFVSSNIQWQKIINPKFVTEHQLKQNWWIINRNTYGNEIWLGKRFFIPCVIIFTISYITWGFAYIGFYGEIIPSMVDLLFIAIPTILCVILYYKTPVINDSFLIKAEMKRIFIAYFFLILSYSSWWILKVIFGILWWELPEAFTIAFSHLCIFMIMTSWIIKKANQNQLLYVHIRNGSTTETCSTDGVMHHMSTGNNDAKSDIKMNIRVKPDSNHVTLEQILSNSFTISKFMNHVTSEWSIEVLVSFIEITQFLQCMVNVCDGLNDKREYIHKIVFPDTVPKTALISDDVHAEFVAFKKIGLEMYNKYMSSHSEMCINISYDMNMRIYNFLNNELVKKHPTRTRNVSNVDIDKIEVGNEENVAPVENKIDDWIVLFSLFDNVRREMYKLLKHSYVRFSVTGEYNKIVECKQELFGDNIQKS